jgi:arsenate reductase
MTKVTIYHNPRCSKSRQTLTLLRERGIEPEMIEYLKNPPSESTLARLIKMLAIEPQASIRKKEYAALGLPESDNPDELIARMASHPEIIERPIVVAGQQACLGRPPENVLEII